MSAKLLLVDDDHRLLDMIGGRLEKMGYEVQTARDGEGALKIIPDFTPSIIITDILMPGMDGWSLIRRLRAQPETAFIPVIFMTMLNSEDDRIRGFRLGADDYLPKPFRAEELDLRIKKVIKNSATPDTAVRLRGKKGVNGTLGDFGVSSLLILLDMEEKSGELIIQSSDQTAHLYLRDGQVVDALLDGNEHFRGQECVYHVLQWPEGDFQFIAKDVDMEDEIGANTNVLLMEGARRLDEKLAED